MQGKRKQKLKETCIEVSLYLLTYTGNIKNDKIPLANQIRRAGNTLLTDSHEIIYPV